MRTGFSQFGVANRGGRRLWLGSSAMAIILAITGCSSTHGAKDGNKSGANQPAAPISGENTNRESQVSQNHNRPAMGGGGEQSLGGTNVRQNASNQMSQSQTYQLSRSATNQVSQANPTAAATNRLAMIGATNDLAAAFLRELGRAVAEDKMLAELGIQQASDEQLKDYCQNLNQTAEQFRSQLQPVADGAGVDLPKDGGLEFQLAVRRLAGKHGSAFDRELIRQAMQFQAETVLKARQAAPKLKEGDAKKFADSHLAVLERLFAQSKLTASKIGVPEEAQQEAIQNAIVLSAPVLSP